MTLQADGTAVVAHLDGEDFDFDRGWRMSGTGTWQLINGDSGQLVSLSVTERTSWEERHDTEQDLRAPEAVEQPAPETYAWSLRMERGDKGLRLFFLFGDPDIRSYHYLDKSPDTESGSPASPSAAASPSAVASRR
ncbi:hypothetical protein OG883_35345 [Streptomyces sp. NBC_01142]|uniref:hypothetical protein n=1 Tax=Streptomyces sp. NBC_01142 TaxID=2975865 RepID=UPI002250C27F|nr:hypothetical protein [Streptomyces sp. NBC_01142]MCX4825046.1 hypothetical protein [Streptomyces sp. NBC_01142]